METRLTSNDDDDLFGKLLF